MGKFSDVKYFRIVNYLRTLQGVYISRTLFNYTDLIISKAEKNYANEVAASSTVSATELDGSGEGKIFLAPSRHVILDLIRAKMNRQRMLAMILLYDSLVLEDAIEAIHLQRADGHLDMPCTSRGLHNRSVRRMLYIEHSLFICPLVILLLMFGFTNGE